MVGSRVDAAHHGDLSVTFRDVLLVDAKGVGPDSTDSGCIAQVTEGGVEGGADRNGVDVVEDYGSLTLG